MKSASKHQFVLGVLAGQSRKIQQPRHRPQARLPLDFLVEQKGATETAILGYLPERVRHEVLKFHNFKTFFLIKMLF